MPRFRVISCTTTSDLRVARVACDGVDARRPVEERADADRVWILLQGRFLIRHRSGRHVIDPTTALLVGAGDAYEIRHPDGGDVCLSVGGAFASSLVDRGAGTRPFGAEPFIRARAAAARVAAGDGVAALALEEILTDALTGEPRPGSPGPSERAVADTIARTVRLRFDERLPLAELAREAGVSMFHACRAFRRATGGSIHQYQLEVRLRHALALLLDTRASLADVAAATGFASQAHLTSRFRRRYGVTPGACRAGHQASASPSVAVR